MVTRIVIMIICVIFSAYFSATETAFSSANKTRFKAMMEKGNKKATLAFNLSEKYDSLISTILIGNNIVNITLASIGTLFFTDILGGKVNMDTSATIATVVVTVVVLIFGEIIPKSIAKDYPEKFAMFSAPFINLLIKLFLPLNFLFSLWKKLIGKIIKGDDENKMSQEELLLLLDEVQQEGTIDENESELIHNAVEFGDLEVQSILTHRVDLEGVDINATKEEIARKFTETRYSRLLVYDETIDKIVGVIHLKDFYKDSGVTSDDVSTIMTPPLFIHQTEKVNTLLKSLQSSKSHIAIVVDEYGGTLGIVTMEDILEELVGEIWDEHDEVEEPYKQIDENTYIVDCTVALEEFCDRFDIDNHFESISLGGWIMEQAGCIPEENDGFDYENLTITVVKTDNHRVETVKVVVNPAADEDEEKE
jgi:putative hemolysin